MGFVKNEEIRGYQFDNEVVCSDCATKQDLEELKEDEILTEDDIEKSDGTYFCDRCKKEI